MINEPCKRVYGYDILCKIGQLCPQCRKLELLEKSYSEVLIGEYSNSVDECKKSILACYNGDYEEDDDKSIKEALSYD